MHHAWILAGAEGLGKASFARAAAAELVAQTGTPQPPPDRHPDILAPEHPPENKVEAQKRDDGQPYKTKRSIPIDEIRAMQQRLTTRPTLGARRAVIIDPADDLETNAVNALLKSLEEPPAGTFFLLVSHRPGRLLPTVRSRCRILRFDPLSDDAVARIVTGAEPGADAATRAAAVAAARGSPGMALGFVGQGLGPVHQAMVRILQAGDDHFEQRGALADAIGARPDRERMQAACDLARALVAGALDNSPPARQRRLIAAHGEIARLASQVATYNYDPALLVMEIGGLLASAALPRETA
ncbi:DNA polymerase III subunit delta' [Parablastomonas sp. CN1-191]|uniref:DNA polymerase III subunit delta' n=1 Tax=Parablastomonas sp. CN1-191 TaxID=3400908 RepID=UPI003BF8ED86